MDEIIATAATASSSSNSYSSSSNYQKCQGNNMSRDATQFIQTTAANACIACVTVGDQPFNSERPFCSGVHQQASAAGHTFPRLS